MERCYGKKLDSLQKIDKITVVSFLLAIGVMCIHNFIYYTGDASVSETFVYIDNVWKHLLTSCVAFFFMISGFLFFRSYRGDWRGTVKKKIYTLMVPYVIWSSVYWICKNVLARCGSGVITPINENIVWFVVSDGEVCWFIRYLFILQLVSCILYRLLKDKRTAWIVWGGLCSYQLFIFISHTGYSDILYANLSVWWDYEYALREIFC
jgi:fucose 4-O-acetylase-like acetyltransferase